MITESEILKKFGERVRQLRKQKDISQEKLAYRADLHRTYIGMIERAEKNITLLNIEKIAVALDVPISDTFKSVICQESDSQILKTTKKLTYLKLLKNKQVKKRVNP